MNEIAIYQHPEGLSLVEMRSDANKFPRLSVYTPASAENRLAQIVAMAMTYTGRQFQPGDLRLIARALYSELMRDPDGIGTRNICMEEIGHAVRQAVLGNDMYGINVASLYKAVRNYCTGEGHDAQQEANARRTQQRQQALRQSTAGAMLDAYTTKALTQFTTKK